MNAWPVAALPPRLETFMADAYALEREAAQRYVELADMMDACNNTDVAQLFRTMAGYEELHASRIAQQMGWQAEPPVPTSDERPAEAPEAIARDELHYMMQPWHALKLALAAERAAVEYFASVARAATDEHVFSAAVEFQKEEEEHVALVEAWLARVPQPAPDWDQDPDPPRYTE